MKKILALLLLAVISCSKEETPIVKNSVPGAIQIISIEINDLTATIDWNDVTDKDGDEIYYSFFLDNTLIEETTESSISIPVESNTNYSGRIIATDKNGGHVEIEFSIEGPKTKILYFLKGFTYLVAYDLEANKILWNKYSSSHEAHTIYKNQIFAGNQSLQALDLVSGEMLWEANPSGFDTRYRDAVTDGTNLYAFNASANLVSMNLETKEKIWERSFMDVYAPMGMDENYIFVNSRNDDHVYAIDKETGNKAWSFSFDNYSGSYKSYSNPLVFNSNLYLGDYFGGFYCLDKESGMLKWYYQNQDQISFSSGPTVYEESIIACSGNVLYSFKENGELNWTFSSSGASFRSSPFVYEDKIFLCSKRYNENGAELLCLDAETGSKLWSYNLRGEVSASPIVFEDTVYLGDWAPYMYAINANTGALEWEFNAGETIFKSPTIVVGNGEEIIYPSSHGQRN